MRFSGKTVVVTGAATGLGRAIVELLGAEGANLVLVDKAERELASLSDGLRSRSVPVDMVVGDVSLAKTSTRTLDLAIKRHGRIDVLMNNAGINPVGALGDTSDQTWSQTMDVNLKSAYLFCHAFLPTMIAQRNGVIVNTASIAGQRASTAEAAYAISKAALIMLTRTIARDYATLGIRANAICPGVLENVMADRRSRMSADDVELRSSRAAETVPMRRLGTYSEVARCIAFLASDDASYVNGAQLTVDGGLTA
jgi:NAD(P)-dependent dehydrogenase (short-subunit alcohol dehydrogenase family)